jgi:cell division protein FtsW
MRKPDKALFIAVWVLVAFGLVALTSASYPTGFDKFHDAYYFFKKQLLVGVLPGTFLFFIASRLSLQTMRKIAPWCLLGALILLGLPLIPGLQAGYGHAWVNFLGYSFQASETAKLLLAFYFAWWLARRGDGRLKTFWDGLFPFVVTVGVVAGLMVLQSDLGTTSVILAMLFSMYVAAGAPWTHIGTLIASAAALFVAAIKVAPYRVDRLKVFLHPELDPQGVGYHVNQAMLAVGSGGWFGLGLGNSLQKHLYLPQVTADSIFAIISEELGFLVSVAVIAGYLFIFWRGLRIARAATDPFARNLAVGIVAWICFQAFLNISAMLGVMPLTGVPLPFISAGGSAMLANLAAMGVLYALSKGESGPVRRSAVS